MTKQQKRLERLQDKRRSITFDEARSLLEALGFSPDNKGKTSGSRIRFFREKDGAIVSLHKPHPDNTLKGYQRDEIIEVLKERGDLDE